jgi:ArsR family transcriptional regulator
MADQAGRAAQLLRSLAHDARLLVLCVLVEAGEASAGRLVEVSGLSQSALSQHLGKLRAEGLVRTRREGTRVIYAIADPKVTALLTLLHSLFCRAGSQHAQKENQ